MELWTVSFLPNRNSDDCRILIGIKPIKSGFLPSAKHQEFLDQTKLWMISLFQMLAYQAIIVKKISSEQRFAVKKIFWRYKVFQYLYSDFPSFSKHSLAKRDDICSKDVPPWTISMWVFPISLMNSSFKYSGSSVWVLHTRKIFVIMSTAE